MGYLVIIALIFVVMTAIKYHYDQKKEIDAKKIQEDRLYEIKADQLKLKRKQEEYQIELEHLNNSIERLINSNIAQREFMTSVLSAIGIDVPAETIKFTSKKFAEALEERNRKVDSDVKSVE